MSSEVQLVQLVFLFSHSWLRPPPPLENPGYEPTRLRPSVTDLVNFILHHW